MSARTDKRIRNRAQRRAIQRLNRVLLNHVPILMVEDCVYPSAVKWLLSQSSFPDHPRVLSLFNFVHQLGRIYQPIVIQPSHYSSPHFQRRLYKYISITPTRYWVTFSWVNEYDRDWLVTRDL